MNAQNAVLSENEAYAVIKDPKNRYEIIPTDSQDYKLKIKNDWILVYAGSQSDCQAYETNGQIFKKKHGFSKSMKRNMKRKGLDPLLPESLVSYREIRKNTMKTIQEFKKRKHDKARAGKKTKVLTNKK